MNYRIAQDGEVFIIIPITVMKIWSGVRDWDWRNGKGENINLDIHESGRLPAQVLCIACFGNQCPLFLASLCLVHGVPQIGNQ